MSHNTRGVDPLTVAKELETKENCKIAVHTPDVCEAFIDLDSVEAEAAFYTRFEFLTRNAEFKYTRITYSGPSRRGRGKHIVVRFEKPLIPAQRVAFQSLLGSDWQREMMAYVDECKQSDFETSVFFENADNNLIGERSRETITGNS